jgi:hypothetical protein
VKPWLARGGLGALLAAGAFATSWYHSGQLHPVIYADAHAKNILFDADPGRVIESMSHRESAFQRFSATHPLFSLLTYPAVFAIKRLLGMPPLPAVRVVIALIAGRWAITLFAVLLLLGLRVADAGLFTLLGLGSAAGLFWLAIPETYSLGSISILTAIGVAAIVARRPGESGDSWLLGASAFSLSVTVTNWMAGLSATAASRRWSQTIQISLTALALVTLGWGVERQLFPASRFFLDPMPMDRFIVAPEAGGPLDILTAFFVNAVVMPAIQVAPGASTYWYLPVLTAQHSAPGSASGFGLAAVVAWLLLLMLGAGTVVRDGRPRGMRLALLLTLAGQAALHLVFGTETFLYSLNFAPLLILVAALAAQGRTRKPTLALALVAVICGSINNVQLFRRAAAFTATRATEAYWTDQARASRPTDPFPRSQGHVILSLPGTPADMKAYHEPGGSFSPAAGTFGVGIWITDSTGHLAVTSDNIPIGQIEQSFRWEPAAPIPDIITETPYYEVRWTALAASRFRMTISRIQGEGFNASVVIRSTGPAGGPVRTLRWDGTRLQVNGEWEVIPTPTTGPVTLGREGRPDWKNQRPGTEAIDIPDGWGFARIPISGARVWEAEIRKREANRPTPLAALVRPGTIALDLPDPRFAASLEAQVAHLLMGLVEDGTRPGDPLSYPGPWLNDEAHIALALARSGQLPAARDAGRHLATTDFFGGLGARADAPGIAIAALTQLAPAAADSGYARWLWPHVQRKAEWILAMRTTAEGVRVPLAGPLLPSVRDRHNLDRVSEGSRDGLILPAGGRGELGRVNGINHYGLLAAAALAERLGELSASQRYRDAAEAMERAWESADWIPAAERMRTPQLGTSAIQTFLASQPARGGEEARRGVRTPRRAAVLAQAHLELLAGRLDQAWTTVRRFWVEEESPGLFSWSERSGVDATYERWERVRGWTDRGLVTPEYEVAAQMLLLQLDMLAYEREGGSATELVIGQGIPPVWVDHPLRVTGLPIGEGTVNWEWDGNTMRVTLQGIRRPIRLGPAFPRDARIVVSLREAP